MGYKTVVCSVNHIAFACNTDRRKYVVPSTHNITNAGVIEFLDYCTSLWLQFVFEHYETNEIKFGLCF